jgi:2',3'-cyclic-nucleotide 2'-phosphodiesterase (5'-nucleotidase family)
VPALRIISINDVYSLESLPRLKTLVKEHSRGPFTTLVVLAGDFVAPSLLSSLDAGRGMVDCLNDIGVTHVCFGNHEDDIPVAELKKRMNELDAVWLSSNVHFDSPRVKVSDTITIPSAGPDVRVGLLGVVVVDTMLYRDVPFGGAPIEPANEVAMREAARLVREGCAFIVPITHQAIDDDRALARAGATPPFPVIVGGHEHVPFIERIGPTWIVKAGSDATAAVITDIVWEAGVATTTTRLEPVAGNAENHELRERVDAHMAKVHDIENASLVMLAPGETLSSVGSRVRPTTLGTLLCSAIRDALGADACLFNGGGIRGGRDYHTHFTYGDLETEVPFDNEIVVVRLPGRVVREAIAASRSHAPAESGAFLQTDNALDVAKLEEDREYRVAIVRNLLTGMDHIEPLVRFAHEHPEKIPPALTGRDVKHVLVDAFAVALWRKLGRFDEIDANHDGVITEPEVAAALARVTAEAPSHVTAQLLVRALDKNADNVISRAELAEIESRKERESQ